MAFTSWLAARLLSWFFSAQWEQIVLHLSAIDMSVFFPQIYLFMYDHLCYLQELPRDSELDREIVVGVEWEVFQEYEQVTSIEVSE